MSATSTLGGGSRVFSFLCARVCVLDRGAVDSTQMANLPREFLSSIRVNVVGTRNKRPEAGKAFTAYKILVRTSEGKWEVQHRYSVLRELHKLLCRELPKGTKLPKFTGRHRLASKLTSGRSAFFFVSFHNGLV